MEVLYTSLFSICLKFSIIDNIFSEWMLDITVLESPSHRWHANFSLATLPFRALPTDNAQIFLRPLLPTSPLSPHSVIH